MSMPSPARPPLAMPSGNDAVGGRRSADHPKSPRGWLRVDRSSHSSDRHSARPEGRETSRLTCSFRDSLVQHHPDQQRQRVVSQQVVGLVDLAQVQSHTHHRSRIGPATASLLRATTGHHRIGIVTPPTDCQRQAEWRLMLSTGEESRHGRTPVAAGCGSGRLNAAPAVRCPAQSGSHPRRRERGVRRTGHVGDDRGSRPPRGWRSARSSATSPRRMTCSQRS